LFPVAFCFRCFVLSCSPSHLLCLCRAVFIKTPATAGYTPAEYIASAVAPTETSVLVHRPADDSFDFARRSLRRPSSRSCSSILRRRRRYETSPKRRLRRRMRALSRHAGVFHGSDRGFFVGAEATGSKRRGTSTNALNDRVLRSTDSSLDGMIRCASVAPNSTINRNGQSTTPNTGHGPVQFPPGESTFPPPRPGWKCRHHVTRGGGEM
jgi:hypothetical protein